MIKLNKRTLHVKNAGLEISNALLRTTNGYELTYGELVKILSEELLNLSKYMIREERHPDDPNKRGDEA